jgi:hypothetical protein
MWETIVGHKPGSSGRLSRAFRELRVLYNV